MLGDKVGVMTGKVIGTRVLNVGHGPKVETTFDVSGEMGGVGTTMMGTYWAIVQPDGSLYGECPEQGVLMTADGGVGTWALARLSWVVRGSRGGRGRGRLGRA